MALGDLVATLRLDISDFVRAVQEAKERARGIALPELRIEGIEITKRKMLDFSTAINAVSNKLLAIGSGIVASLSAILYTAAKAGDAMYEYSLRTGIAVENLSALQYAAEQTGTDMNALLWSFKFLERQMVEVVLGSERARRRFGDLGIAVLDSSGKMRPVMEVIFDIADALSAMTTQQEKAGFASRIFGLRYGAALVPMLSQGRRALEELMQKARDLNIVMSTEAAVALDTFKDSLITLRYSLAAIGRELAVAMTPVVEAFSDIGSNLASMISRFVSAHPVFSRFTTTLTFITGGILISTGAFGKFIGYLTRLQAEIGGLSTALRTLGVSIITMLSNPITVATAAVIGLASAYLVLSQRIDSFSNSLRTMASRLKEATSTGNVEAMSEAMNNLNKRIEEGYRALGTWERRMNVLRRSNLGIALLVGELAYTKARREIGSALAEALMEEAKAREVYRQKIEALMATQLEEKGLTSDMVARYISLSRSYDELSIRIDVAQKARETLNREFEEGKMTEETYTAINKALGNILEETGKEIRNIYDSLEELRSKYPQVQEAAEEFTQTLRDMVMTSVEYYDSINKIIDALTRAYGVPADRLIELRTRLLEMFRGTEAEEKALSDLISDTVEGITTSRREMRKAYDEMERLVERTRDTREEYNRSIEEANEKYRESVIKLANRIREAYELQLEIPKISDFTTALNFVNTIIYEKSQEANRLFELAHLEREKILSLSNERLIDAEREFVRQMIDIDREYTRRQGEVSRQFTNLREQLISVLDRFYDFRNLVKMSDAELARLAERIRKGQVRRAAPESAVEEQYRGWYQAAQTLGNIYEQMNQLQAERLSIEQERAERESELRQRIIRESEQMRTQVLDFTEDMTEYSKVLEESIARASETFSVRTQEITSNAQQIIRSFEESGVKLSFLSRALEKITTVPVAEGYEGLQNLYTQLKSLGETVPPIHELSDSIRRITGSRITLDTSGFVRQIDELKRLLDAIPSEKVVRIKVIRESVGGYTRGNLRDMVIENTDEFVNSIF